MLHFDKSLQNGVLCYTLTGDLDTLTAPDLERELAVSIGEARSLVFDCAKLAYISSAGLRVLLGAQKTMNRQGSMKLLHVGDNIMDIFEVTGFTDIMTIE